MSNERVQAAFESVLLELGYTDQDGAVAEVRANGVESHYKICGSGSKGDVTVRPNDVHFYITRLHGRYVARHFYVDDLGSVSSLNIAHEPSASSVVHVSAEEISCYVSQNLEEADRLRIEVHLIECVGCSKAAFEFYQPNLLEEPAKPKKKKKKEEWSQVYLDGLTC